MSDQFNAFIAQTKVVFGVGAISDLPEKIRPLTPSRAVIVADPAVVEAGWVDTVRDLLAVGGIPSQLFDGVVSNPRLETVLNGIEQVGRQAGDVLVAVGGGSAIDTAKAMAMPVKEPDDLKALAGFDMIADPLLPIIAIPSTSGTGSEVSVWTVLTDSDSRSRVLIGSPRLAPFWAICDPELTTTVPPDVTAYTGLDGLTHAIEAFTSNNAWPPSEALALGAAVQIRKGLKDAFDDSMNFEARGLLMMGSIMAGLALNSSGLGIAHALSNPMGGFLDAPHGLINAVLIPHVMEFNLSACPQKYTRVAHALGLDVRERPEMEAGRTAVDRVRELIKSVELGDVGLRDLGLGEDQIPGIVDRAMESRNISLNPRPAGPDDLAEICRKAL